MPLRKTKASELLDVLGAPWAPPLDELGLHRVIEECNREMAKVGPRARRGLLIVAAKAWLRLDLPDAALAVLHEALALADSQAVRIAMGRACLRKNEFDEALLHFQAAQEQGSTRVVLTNLAYTLHALGRFDDAVDAFHASIAAIDPSRKSDYFGAAELAASFHEDALAVELLARFVALYVARSMHEQDPVEFLDARFGEGALETIRLSDALNRSYQAMGARSDALVEFASREPDFPEDMEQTREDAFRAMAPYRARANLVALDDV